MVEFPLISIITPVLNNEADLEFCIASVANQKYSRIEHIFIDGLSADGSLEILRKNSSKYPHIRWISEQDDGIFGAMNKGIRIASGEWVYFLGSDDVLHDADVLDSIFGGGDPASDVICGIVKLKHTDVLLDVKPKLVQLLERGFHHQAVFCRRQLFDRFGTFDGKYRGVADWEFNMRWFSVSSIRRKHVDRVIALYNEKGYSNDHQDLDFIADKTSLIRKHFPIYVYLAYRFRLYAFLDVTGKGYLVLKKEGAVSFFRNLYRFFVHGRASFRDVK